MAKRKLLIGVLVLTMALAGCGGPEGEATESPVGTEGGGEEVAEEQSPGGGEGVGEQSPGAGGTEASYGQAPLGSAIGPTGG